MPIISADDLPDEVAESLAEMLSGMGKKKRRRGYGKEKMLPEALQMRLEEAAGIYAKSLDHCPYGIGDLVTPRNGYAIKGHGRLYRVVDLCENPAPDFRSGDVGNVVHGRRQDMRVMTIIHDDIVCFWSESYQYEPYDPAVHKGEDENEE